MSQFRVPIPGYKDYLYDLKTQEIVNKHGNIHKTHYDLRGNRIVQLITDDGRRLKLNFFDLVDIILQYQQVKDQYDDILPTVLAAYYNKLEDGIQDLELLDQAKLIKKDVPGVETILIGRILSKMHSSAKR